MSSLRLTVEHPSAHVTVATEGEMLSFVGKTAIYSEEFDGDILSISTNRDMSQDCPTFSLNIVYRNDWYTKIGSNDLILIALQRPPEAIHNVIVGLVDDVRKTTDFSTGKPMRAFSITGRGFNKALQSFNIGALSELTVTTSVQGFFSNMLDVFSGASPAVIIKGVLDNYIGTGCNYGFANGKSFKDYYQESIKDNSNGSEFLADATSFSSYQGGLWDFLKELKNAPFNELFWEIINDKPTIIFRPTPFEQESWKTLQCITIKDSDIIREDLGRSDLETYVLYKVKAETFGADTDILGYLPYWYPPYYTKYGIRRLEVYSKYLEYDGDLNHTILDKMEKLFNWNIKNNVMENGTLTVKGFNSYKIGTRILVESTNMEYYCEGVSHLFTFGSGWTTTLSLTRGLKPEDRFTSPWGEHIQMTPEDASKIYGYTVSESDIGTVDTMRNKIMELFSNWFNLPGGWGDPTGDVPSGSSGDLVNVAIKEIGTKESDGSYHKYTEWYYGKKKAVAWCAVFVSWCANQAGIPTSVIKKYEGCDDGMNWFINQNRFKYGPHYGGDSYSPKAGDIIFFSKYNKLSDSTHTGIVESSDGNKVYTIEGNTTDSVARRNYLLTDKSILGYGTPNYSSIVSDLSNPPDASNTSENEMYIYKFLTGTMKLNTAAACGVLANIEAESSFNPTASGDKGTSYGICQWHNDRFTKLKNWCSSNNYDYKTLKGQLHYLHYELVNSRSSVWNFLSGVPNTGQGAYDAGYHWCYYFEIPKNRATKSVTRGNKAKGTYWKKYTK